jgi:hypothetical protein
MDFFIGCPPKRVVGLLTDAEPGAEPVWLDKRSVQQTALRQVKYMPNVFVSAMI